MNNIPDYKSYSINTLEVVLKRIDREQYPDRVKIIQEELALKRKLVVENESEVKSNSEKESSNILFWIAGGSLLFVLFGIYLMITTQFSFWLLPFYLTLTAMAVGSILIFRKSIYGPEILMYSFVPQFLSVSIGGFKFTCIIGTWLLVGIKDSLSFFFNFRFGNVEYVLTLYSINNSEFYLSINLFAILFFFLIKQNYETYKE